MGRRFVVAQLADRLSMPADADVLAVEIGRLLVAYDPDAPRIDRRFIELRDGDEIPRNARFVGGYRPAGDLPHAVFELFDTDVPADLDPERHADYRLLLAEGYAPVQREGVPNHSWRAPDNDEPRSMGAYMAVARLQEHGYGPIVG